MASTPRTSRAPEWRALLRLALPIIVVNVGNLLTGAVDTAVVGRAGEIELGAVGLGSAVFFVISVVGMGVMLGLDPLVSQALGAGKPARARHFWRQGMWLAALIALPLASVALVVAGLLGALGIDSENAALAFDYVLWRSPSMGFFLMLAATRSYLQAHDVTRPLVVGVILANVVNLPVSWGLVFGDAGLAEMGVGAVGLPAMGTAGAGLASSIAVLIQLMVLWTSVRNLDTNDACHGNPWRFDAPAQKQILGLGIGIGGMFFAEVGVFALASFLMGLIGPLELAAHQVAITVASTAFMVPMGIGAAAAVRVGRAVGAGDAPGARRAGIMAFQLGVGFSLAFSVIFVLAPELLARIFTDDRDVVAAAVPMLYVAAVFQLTDGIQAIGAGALRGAGDTRWPMLANIAGHYVLGVPVGIGLGFGMGMGAVGIWCGLATGLSAVAIALVRRFFALSRRPLERVDELEVARA